MTRISRHPQLLQVIDRHVAVLVCLVLTWVRRVGDFLGGGALPRAPRNILFLKLAEQGSTVLAHMAIERAVEKVGRENVYFLVFEENRFILDALRLIPEENVLTVETGSFFAMGFSCLRRLGQARRLGIEACIDLEFFARSSAAIAFLTGAPVRVGFHAYFGEGPYRGDLMTHRVLYNPFLHTSQTFWTLVAALDQDPKKLPTLPMETAPAPDSLPQFVPPPEDVAVTRQLVEEAFAGEISSLILLNANASDLLPLRKWQSENYVALTGLLLERYPEIRIVFTGIPEEAAAADRLAAQVGSPRCASLAGKTSLSQLLALYGMAEVLVTNDSGPAHFAALTSMDTVTLFGPETPRLFGTLLPRSHILWAAIPCSPCVSALNNRQSACTDNVCMKKISVAEVFEAVCGAYENRLNAGRQPSRP